MRTRRREGGGRSSMGTGTTSLLMIFTVLCFATLALLSLSTAYSNRNIQRRSIEQAAAQASAEGEAATKLAELDRALLGAQEAEWPAIAKAQGWAENEEGGWELDTAMGEDHMLRTRVTLTPGEDTRYRLEAQRSDYIGEWQPVGGEVWTG